MNPEVQLSTQIFLFDKHVQRLLSSKEALAKELPEWQQTNPTKWTRAMVSEKIIEKIKDASLEQVSRVRVTVPLDLDDMKVVAVPVSHFTQPVDVYLDTIATPSQSLFIRNKTTNREVYDEARKRLGTLAFSSTFVDVLLFNERGQITETSISNIAIERKDGKWYTPAFECGLLPGIMRRSLLDDGKIVQRVITVDDLREAISQHRRIKCFNAVRREYDVRIIIND